MIKKKFNNYREFFHTRKVAATETARKNRKKCPYRRCKGQLIMKLDMEEANWLLLLLLLLLKQIEEYFYKNLKGRRCFRYETRPQITVWDRESITTQFKAVVNVLNQAKSMCHNINSSKPPERFFSLTGIFSSVDHFVLPVTVPLQVPYKISPYFYFTPAKIQGIKAHRE